MRCSGSSAPAARAVGAVCDSGRPGWRLCVPRILSRSARHSSTHCRHSCSSCFVSAGIYWIVGGWRVDLIENRRKLRWMFLLLFGSLVFVMVLLERLLPACARREHLSRPRRAFDSGCLFRCRSSHLDAAEPGTIMWGSHPLTNLRSTAGTHR